jgi:hypothetical protein
MTTTKSTIRVTPAFAALVAELAAAKKTPWLIVNDDYAVGAYAGRNEARAAKAKMGGAACTIVKAADVNVEVIDLAAKPAKVTTAPAEILRKSEIESPCFTVWDTADKMVGARRKDVLAACLAKGIAFYTARTQYQLWLTSKKADEAVKTHKGGK